MEGKAGCRFACVIYSLMKVRTLTGPCFLFSASFSGLVGPRKALPKLSRARRMTIAPPLGPRGAVAE